MSRADLLVVGRSSSPALAAEELTAANAAFEAGVPFGIYSDNYIALPPHFFEAAEKASFLCVLNESIAESARRFLPRLEVIASGNPMWESFCFPKYTREQVRSRLNFSPEQKVILSPGCKTAVVNILLWGNLIEAVKQTRIANLQQINLLLSRHPGDQTPQEIYDALSRLSCVPLEFLKSEKMSSSDALPGCDLVVECCSSVGMEAAHQRIPVITFFTEISLAWIESVKGSRVWEPAQAGATTLVTQATGLRLAIADLLLNKEAIARLRRNQEQVFPKPPAPGAAAKIMADAAEWFSKKKPAA